MSLAISIILFEGGLTLRKSEVENVGTAITRLITLGGAITFVGGGLVAYYVFGLGWEMSALFSALIIVTGPTVISPILRNIPLKKDVASVLKWEGILIDPIGALAAVLMFEFIRAGVGAGFTMTALLKFGKILLFGSTFGFSFAHALIFVINKRLVPHYLSNVVSLSVVLLAFVLPDIFEHESGLLSVVVMGLVMANSKFKSFDDLLYFKESLSVLLISILFILLSANMNIKDLMLIAEWKTLALFALVVFVIRPLSVFISTRKSTLKFNEKLFISWVGPRGIVAAGIASLFGTKLMKQGVEGAEYITPLVFMIVLGTVLLNATTARLFAKLVGVFLKNSEAILIVGATDSARLIASYLQKNDRRVVLVDRNKDHINTANKEGLTALNLDVYNDELDENIELNEVGYLLAMTGSDEVNKYAVEMLSDVYGEKGAFRLASSKEVHDRKPENSDRLLTLNDDYLNLSETIRDYHQINEIEVTSNEDYYNKLQIICDELKTIPLFLKTSNSIEIIAELKDDLEIKEKDKLVYAGKKLEF